MGPASLQGKIVYLGGQPFMLQECSGSDVSIPSLACSSTLFCYHYSFGMMPFSLLTSEECIVIVSGRSTAMR